jgi:hypothetical protein
VDGFGQLLGGGLFQGVDPSHALDRATAAGSLRPVMAEMPGRRVDPAR